MDRRAAKRVKIDSPATVKILGETGAGAIAGRIVNTSAAGLGLTLEAPVAPGTAVRVDCAEALFLGEVRYCGAEQAGFSVGLQVEHALYDLPGLARLARELLEDAPCKLNA